MEVLYLLAPATGSSTATVQASSGTVSSTATGRCDDRDKFLRFLPAGAIVAHKTGSTEPVRNDAGIVFLPDCAVAIYVLTADNDDTRGDAENAGTLLCAKVAKEVYEYFRKR